VKLIELAKTIEGQHVVLEPLNFGHRDELVVASNDGQLSTLWFTGVPNEQNIDEYISKALKQQDNNTAIPFAVIDNKTNRVIGSTRICNADIEHRRFEIGYTWYAKSFQQTAVNTECKFLLLTLAFEKLNAIAVEFRTHWHNQASRRAIARIGAKQDGVLRNHRIHESGEYRDTVVFSIIESEWPMVRKSLIYRLNQPV